MNPRNFFLIDAAIFSLISLATTNAAPPPPTLVGDAASLQSAVSAGDPNIVLTASIAVTGPIYVGTTSSPTITINGAGFPITGTSEIFFVQSGNITLSNTTLTGTAVGGNGGAADGQGGGALGAGGAIFIGANANVTVSGVQFTNNTATGGSGATGPNGGGGGGGGGLNGGNGGVSASPSGGGGGGNGGSGGSGSFGGGGGGGGLGPQSTGGNATFGGGGSGAGGGGDGAGFSGNGGAGSTNGGGGGGDTGGAGGAYGGGGGATDNGGGLGGSGGFGGGGGGGGFNVIGGAGGFGGGGGGSVIASVASGGVGAGAGASGSFNEAGGGGAALGSAIFVQAGGSLTINGSQTFSGSAVTAGTGANNGAAAGTDLFLMSGTTTVLAPGTGNTLTFNGTIADDSAASLPSGQSYTPGSAAGAALTIGSVGSPNGTVVLNGANTYSGGTTLQNGTLVLGNSQALGSGALVTVDPTVVYANGDNIANPIIMMGDTTLEVDNADSATQSGAISESGGSFAVTKAGTGALALTNVNTFTGGTTISAGILQAENNSALGSGDVIVSSGGSLQLNGGITLANNITINGTGAGGAGAIFANDNNAETVSGNITLASDASINSSNPTPVLHLSGTVNLGSSNLTIGGSSETEMSGHTTGTGGVTVATGSFVFLDGPTANTYTGLTTVQSGAILALNKFPGVVSIAGDLAISGTVNEYQSGQFAVTSTVTLSGTGNLNFVNPGTSETIAGLNGSSATAQVAPTFGGGGNTLTLGGSGTYSYAGQINDNAGGGPGSNMALIMQGTGTQTLSGASNYSGGTTVAGGILQAGSATAFGTGPISFTGGTLQYGTGITQDFSSQFSNAAGQLYSIDTNGNNVTFASALASSGGTFTKLGNGTLFLTGANTYTGGTTVNAGTLDLEPGGGFEEINTTSITVANGATLGLFGYIDQDGTTISGAGANVSTLKGFTPTTSGNGSNTPLFIYSPANETASGAVANPTPYAVSVSGLLITNGLSQGGNANFGGGGAGLGGGAFVGAGATLTLSNVNVTGNIAAGGSTGLDGFANIHGGGGIGGGSNSNNGGGLFANDANGGGGSFGGGGAYNGGGTGNTGGFGGGGGYGFNGGFGGFGGGGGGRLFGNQGFGGVGGGQGSGYVNAYGGGGAGLGGGLFVQNSGSVIVTGNSTISGNTVTAGQGADGGNNGSAAGADIFMMMGSTVTLAPGTGNTVTIGASGDDANGVVSNVADDSAYSVQGGSGAGAVLTVGNNLTPGGTVILHGNNTYAGGTSITNGATLEVFQDNNLGAFDLTNLAVGGVTLSGGELLTETDGFSTTRSITLNAGTNTLAAVTGTTAFYSGLISGEALTVGDASNAGTLLVTGANTFSGGTTINDGVLQLGDGSTPGAALGSGDVTVNASGTFTLDLANNETFSNNIIDDNQVILDDFINSNYTVSSFITGPGTVVKTGANTVTVTGNNNYSGGTTLNDGTLVAGNASAFGTGLLQVNGGTLVMGNGNHTIVVGSYAQTGGTLYLSVNGVGQAAVADLLHVTTANTTQASLGGNLTVDLTNFTVPAPTPGPAKTYTFTLLATDAGYNGTFISYTPIGLPGGLTFSIDYGTIPDDVLLEIGQGSNPFILTGLTPNQQAIGGNINATIAGGGTNPLIVALSNVFVINPGGLGTDLGQLSPQAFGQFASTTAINNASFETEAKDNYIAGQRIGPNGTFVGGNGGIDASGLTLNDPSYDPNLAMVHSRLLAWSPGPLGGLLSDTASPLLGGVNMKDPKEMKSAPVPAYANPWNFYVRGNVILAQGFSQPDVSHFDDNTESVSLGADYRITPNLLIGLAAGYGHTDVTLDNNGSSATVDSYSPGIYASYADKGWYANFYGDYVHNAYTQSRVIGFLGQTADSAPEGNEGVVNLDGGYDFRRGAFTFGPLAGLQYTHLTVDGYTENGSIADLSVNEQNADSLRSRLGGRVSYTFSHCGLTFTPHLDASWQHEFLDQSRGITSQFNDGGVGSFSVQTTNPSRDSALADLGLNAEINRTVTVFADYEVQAGQENYFGQSVQGGVKIGF